MEHKDWSSKFSFESALLMSILLVLMRSETSLDITWWWALFPVLMYLLGNMAEAVVAIYIYVRRRK